MSEASSTPLIELRGITKRYPGVLANDQVSLSIDPGEVHGLIGENGAGKSTLVKVLYGVVRPDSGRILFNGEAVTIDRPSRARSLGIAMVFQHFSLFEPMTVLENVQLALGNDYSRDELAEGLQSLADKYGMPVDPNRTVDELSVGERQRIEILRCLLQEPRLLVMDEPTSVLTPQESEQLFETLRRIADAGCSILFISHKLEEVRSLCARATIMRGGKVIAECDPREESAKRLAAMMVGEDLAEVERAAIHSGDKPIFTVRELNVPAPYPGATALRDISFEVNEGEVFGIAGVAGNGQGELLAALSGETTVKDAGAVTICGVPGGQSDVRARRGMGLGFVPEDRLGHGAVPDMSLAENAFLTGHLGRDLTSRGLIDFRATDDFARSIVAGFDVRTPGTSARAGQLSGGNLQKFILGREILQQPRVLVVAHPTWGVDAGAAVLIRSRLVELAATGTAVIVVSQDLDELLQISHRITVLSEGRLCPPVSAASATIEDLGLIMMGEATAGQVNHATS